MSKAQHITMDGTVRVIEPGNGSDFSLEELQGYVGGYIETVPLRDGRLLVCNEEGKLKGLAPNQMATELFDNMDLIVGNVVVCPQEMLK